MHPVEKLTPGGILEAVSGQAFLFFTDSSKTSDFIVDGLHAWWQSRRRKYKWNGYLLNTVSVVLQRAGNFCWKGRKSIVRLFDVVYEKGVTVSGEDRAQLEDRLHRDPDLPFWDIAMYPKAVF